ncbi:MAG: L,D-transpeptidase [Pseudomonadota bacterium]|uniref:L,D-transpeptidase family protein n=1 Tax=Marinobacter sp. TaxID=50741 RepID=UPI002E88CFD3|nr:L,D-transpeptidase [Pseudomonadota bacterium]
MIDPQPPSIDIDLGRQQLTLRASDGESVAVYSISSGRNGAGERDGSGCTPRGQHFIRALIGAGLPSGTVFRGRRPTGETYTPALADEHPGRDWILSRILWLCGREWGKNRGPGVDTFRRFIYIHGTPDSEPMGVPLSHGCIRMRNADVIDLFDRVRPGTAVLIR